MRIYDLKQKEVINISDGCRYGYISDFEVDKKTGEICKIIVPGPGKVLGMFGREQEYRIDWKKIRKIGEDIILVDVDSDDILVDSD